MIFNTMQDHAKALIDAGDSGSECLILERVGIDFEGMDKAWEKAISNTRTSKLNVPVLLFGGRKTLSVSSFSGGPSGNASTYTFKKKGVSYPPRWFPWTNGDVETLTYEQWKDLLSGLMQASYTDILSLFSKGGALQTFNLESEKLEANCRTSVCLPVTCQKPVGIVHAILGCNAISLDAEGNSVIAPEILRFCLLVWVFDKAAKSIKIVNEPGERRTFSLAADFQGGGNLGDISKRNVVARVADGFSLGEKVTSEDHVPPEFRRFAELTRETELETVKLGAVPYTAPATGKSPTNAFLNPKQDNALSPEVRFGFDKDEVFPLIDGFASLVHGTRFSLGKDLSYYVFPENPENMPEYIETVRDFLSELAEFRNRYFKALEKSASTENAREKKKQALVELLERRRRIWADVWHKWLVSEWIFAFEENVGSANQQQNTWTAVYRHQPLVRTYLLLYTVDDPTLFGQLIQMLKAAAHNLNEDWVVKEVKRLLGSFFVGQLPDVGECWLRWRGYLTRSNLSEVPIKPELWERALAAIMRIRAIDGAQTNDRMKGSELITALNKRSEAMIEKNQEEIRKYLAELFPATAPEDADGEKAAQGKKAVESFIDQRAADYARFVDVESPGWQHVVDGLICGWALKQVCRKLCEENPASVIGGRTLAKQSPTEVRALMVKLVEKAIRAGQRPWNVDTPMEILFGWSLKNAYAAETTLFMDSLSLGFMRYDRRSEQTTQPQTNTGEQQ